jgi:hypothetical protein
VPAFYVAADGVRARVAHRLGRRKADEAERAPAHLS